MQSVQQTEGSYAAECIATMGFPSLDVGESSLVSLRGYDGLGDTFQQAFI